MKDDKATAFLLRLLQIFIKSLFQNITSEDIWKDASSVELHVQNQSKKNLQWELWSPHSTKCQVCLPRWKIHFATFNAHGESHQLLIHQNRLLSVSDVILPLKRYDDDVTKCESFFKPRHSKAWGHILDPEVGLCRSLTSIFIWYNSV